MYCIYIQLNTPNKSKAGYVSGWEKGYYPSVVELDQTYWYKNILFFPSENAARAFAERLADHFYDEIKYWEIVLWR